MIRDLAIRLIGRLIPLRLSIMCNKPAVSPNPRPTDNMTAENERKRKLGQAIADANKAADRAKGWAT